MSKDLSVSMNPQEIKLIKEYKKEIYEAAVEYKNFLSLDKDKIEKDNVYMISKEYIDNFKEKIKYDEISDLFNENTKDNFEAFNKKIENCSKNYLEEIIFSDIKIFGDLVDLEDYIQKGFEFVSKEFLEKMEFEFDDKNPDLKVKFIKDLKNIIIIFNDESKLLIIPRENENIYHTIPAPVKSNKKKPIRSSSLWNHFSKKINKV